MNSVGNDREAKEIAEAWSQIETPNTASRINIQLAAQPNGKAYPDLYCDLSALKAEIAPIRNQGRTHAA